MTFTVKELRDRVNNDFNGYEDPETGDWVDPDENEERLIERLSYPWGKDKDGIEVKPFGVFTTVARWGGEGQGDEAGMVIQHVESGRQFHVGAYYASYDGTYWGDAEWTEVEPIVVTVTRYKNIDKGNIHPEPTIDGTLEV